MDEDQQFCLRWNNHQSTLISVFDTLLEKGTLVDCTLAAEGQFLKAHKVVLSACSPYFAALLTQQYDKHPIFILKDVKFQELRAMMDYMYRGEVNISQDQLAALLKAAESLQIKGLSDSSGGRNNGSQVKDTTAAKQAKGSGLTIEQKMPRTAADMDADLSEAHEGSVSPNARKRKKVRRRSVETNNVDNHDHHSNSSSHSMPHGGAATGGATQQPSQAAQQQPSTAAAAATTMPTNITSATSSANVLSVTKKTDQEMRSDADMDEAEDPKKEVQRQNNGGRKSISAATPMGKQTTTTTTTNKKDGQQSLIEPKNEYDESNEETVEDLTLDEEEMMDDLDQAGPSHGGEGSSQGYSQWPVDRSQENDAFMQGQDGHHRDAQETAGPQGRFALVGGKAIKIEPGTQLNTIATYPPPPQTTTTLPIPQTNLRAIPTANLTNKPVPQLHQATPMGGQAMGAFNIRITKDLLGGPNRAQQQTQAWLTNNTGIILSPSLTIRQIGEVRTVPTTVHQIPAAGTITQQGYLVPQVWRSASFKSTSKPTVMPTLVTKKRTMGVTQFAPPVPERKETTSNDLEQFTTTEERYDSDEEDSDAERVLGHSEDEDDEDDPNVTVDDDYKPPYSVKAKSRGQSSRHNSSGGSDSKKEDTENSKDIKYVEGKDKPWVCKNCHRMYKWKNSLKCHLKNECGLPPKYFCSRDCGYKTNVHSNLKRHLNSKFCKSRDPPAEESTTTLDPEETMLEQNPLLTVIKEEPL